MKITQLSCFSNNIKNSGNIAAVVTNFDTNINKQNLAKELNLPVTVFISALDSTTPLLEFFYPETEMPLCLHGVLGAAAVLFPNHPNNPLICSTKYGQKLEIYANKDLFLVKVSVQPYSNIQVNVDEVCSMLNINRSQLHSNLPFQIASVGSPKLLVPISSLNTLQQLTPDFEHIREWSISSKINGIYAYTDETIDKTANIHARGFNPKTGHNEDVATGVAAAALSLVLKKDLFIEQGWCLNRPSTIVVSYQNDHSILVGGKTTFLQ
jgi:PhzF family phenazine biosynthesis protein